MGKRRAVAVDVPPNLSTVLFLLGVEFFNVAVFELAERNVPDARYYVAIYLGFVLFARRFFEFRLCERAIPEVDICAKCHIRRRFFGCVGERRFQNFELIAALGFRFCEDVFRTLKNFRHFQQSI